MVSYPGVINVHLPLARSQCISTHRPRVGPTSIHQQKHLGAYIRQGVACASCDLIDPATVSALTKLDLHHSATYAFDVAAVDPATAGILSAILRPVLSIASLLMIVRIVLTWYPEVDATKMPWAIAYAPTESLLAATRKVVKPFNGLDVSPIVWVALLSFVSEILTGPQGILSLLQRKGI